MTCVKGDSLFAKFITPSQLTWKCLPFHEIDVIMQTANTQEEQTKHGKDHGKDHVQMHPEIYQTDNQM